MTTTDNTETARNHFRNAAAILRVAADQMKAELDAVAEMFGTDDVKTAHDAYCESILGRALTVEENLYLHATASGSNLEGELYGSLLRSVRDLEEIAATTTEDLEETAPTPDEHQADLNRWQKIQAHKRKERAADIEVAMQDLLPELCRRIHIAADRELVGMVDRAKEGVLSGRIRPAEARF